MRYSCQSFEQATIQVDEYRVVAAVEASKLKRLGGSIDAAIVQG